MERADSAASRAAAGAPARRTAELEQNLAALRARIAAACAAAGRDPGEVTLVAVTKFFPAEDVLRLVGLGQREFGENRDQEASAKAAHVAEALRPDSPATLPRGEPVKPIWHFIGQLQSNKVRSVVSYADVIHSVDRLKLVAALDEAAARASRTPTCLVQVNLDPDAAGRGGAEPGDVERIADAVAQAAALRLGGLMAVAPLGADPGAAFERLAEIADKVRGAHAEAVSLSAGMSGDLEAAVAAGATHVRVGSALLGRRPPLR
jgi:PLP dependent protein